MLVLVGLLCIATAAAAGPVQTLAVSLQKKTPRHLRAGAFGIASLTMSYFR